MNKNRFTNIIICIVIKPNKMYMVNQHIYANKNEFYISLYSLYKFYVYLIIMGLIMAS